MNRRHLLRQGLVSTAVLVTLPRLGQAQNACAKGKTPPQVKGPFYPVVDQLDKDADLIHVEGNTQAATGNVVIVEGVVTNQNCLPVSGVLVEIWQACHTGRYNHPSDPNTGVALDPNFQYWGKAVTDENGFYRFRTIIPGSYPADVGWDRPPHIHFKVARVGYKELITQMYFSGNVLNDKDKILQQLPKSEQAKLVVSFQEIESQPHPVGRFDIQIEKIM